MARKKTAPEDELEEKRIEISIPLSSATLWEVLDEDRRNTGIPISRLIVSFAADWARLRKQGWNPAMTTVPQVVTPSAPTPSESEIPVLTPGDGMDDDDLLSVF